MNKQKRTWQDETGRPVVVKFSNEEVTCPVCESYSVNELVAGCTCERCGQTWVTSVSRK